MTERILRMPEVMARTGYSRSAVYQAMAEGRFPKSIPLGERTVGWVESEVQQFIDDLVAKYRGGEAA
jgi:prophage regulatory protein